MAVQSSRRARPRVLLMALSLAALAAAFWLLANGLPGGAPEGAVDTSSPAEPLEDVQFPSSAPASEGGPVLLQPTPRGDAAR